MKPVYFLIILFVFASTSLMSQSKLQLITKPKGSTIHLRWTPGEAKDWDAGNRNGYILTRETVKRGRKKLSKPENKIVVKLQMAAQSEWEKLAEKNKYAKIPKGYFFDDPILPNELSPEEHQNALRGRMIFTLLAADLSFEVAGQMGLAYVDSNVSPEETYRYIVQLNGSSDSKVERHASLRDIVFSQPPDNFLDKDYVDSTVSLQWDINPQSYYSAYVVEKSSDNGVSYQPADEEPYLPVSNADDLTQVNYSHKVDKLHLFYHFRVRGIDPFGDLGPASPHVRLYAFQSRISPPENLRNIFPSPKNNFILWDFPDSLQASIKGFNVYRNYGPYDPVQENKQLIGKEKKSFLGDLKDIDENIIYKVSAVDLRGRETFSAPFIVTVIDSIAPQKVANLEGEIGEAGVVKICWNIPPDKDIYAYDILRAEGNLKQEFFPVRQVMAKQKIGNQMMALDTITVGKAAYPYVYYMVVPSDYHTNYTPVNDSLKLYRPDIEPPLPPAFGQIANTDTSIIFRFIPSFSRDVERYVFYKIMVPDTNRIVLSRISPDSLNRGFTDMAAEEEVQVRYVLEAFDGAGHSSKDSCNTIVAIPRPFSRPPVDDIKGVYFKEPKTATLKWTYKSRRQVAEYWIFRQENEKGEFKKISTVKGNENSWTDSNVRDKSTYFYIIYAYCDDNTRSRAGKKVKITTK